MFKKAAPVIAGVFILLSPSFVSAETTAELQARIESLLAQIAALQMQLNQISSGTDLCPNILGNQTSVPSGYQLQTGECISVTTLQAKIKVTAPNGGERWEIGQLNTITWAPYGYDPDINPSNKVAVYLEQKVGNNTFVVVGRVMDTGQASLHTYFNIDNYDRWPERGEYYIRAVNNVTGASDRSDAPFTLLSKSIDLKVNGSDGGITVSDNQKLVASWTTANYAFAQCNLSGVRLKRADTIAEIPNLPSSGSRTVYAHVSYPGAFTSIGLECATADGAVKKADYALVVSGPVSASLAITSPNGGEKIPLDQPYLIRLTQSGLKSLSIALYKNDQWLEWLTKDSVPPETLSWTPTRTATVDSESGTVYKIYITGLKADGTGYVDDKSDSPFSLVSSPTASFFASPAVGTKPLTVTLTGSRRACSAHNPVYEEVNRVDFGDGQTSDAVPTCGPFSLMHTYAQTGAYTAKLLTAGYGPAPLQWTTLGATTITVKSIFSRANTNAEGKNEYFANALNAFISAFKGFSAYLTQ